MPTRSQKKYDPKLLTNPNMHAVATYYYDDKKKEDTYTLYAYAERGLSKNGEKKYNYYVVDDQNVNAGMTIAPANIKAGVSKKAMVTKRFIHHNYTICTILNNNQKSGVDQQLQDIKNYPKEVDQQLQRYHEMNIARSKLGNESSFKNLEQYAEKLNKQKVKREEKQQNNPREKGNNIKEILNLLNTNPTLFNQKIQSLKSGNRDDKLQSCINPRRIWGCLFFFLNAKKDTDTKTYKLFLNLHETMSKSYPLEFDSSKKTSQLKIK